MTPKREKEAHNDQSHACIKILYFEQQNQCYNTEGIEQYEHEWSKEVDLISKIFIKKILIMVMSKC